MRLFPIILPALLLTASPLAAEKEPPGEPPDFSDGLARLARLGLPDMRGARWVRYPGPPRNSFPKSYEFRELGLNLTRDVWKLDTEPPTYLEFGSASTVPAPDAAQTPEKAVSEPGIFKKMLRNYRDKNPEPEEESKPDIPPEPEAAQDAAAITARLGKSSVAESINNRMRWSGDSNLHGRLMLFAAQLHAAGETRSANSLAAALFLAVNDDTAVIDGAISHLADSRYDAAVSRFFEETDWETFRTSVGEILETFPRGWTNRPAVALLASRLAKRDPSPPLPTLPNLELNSKAVQLLDRLLEKPSEAPETSDRRLAAASGIDLSDFPAEQRAQIITMLRNQGGGSSSFSISSQNWLLNSFTQTADPQSPPLEQLKAIGIDALPALAAVTGDETTLLPIPAPRNQNTYYGGNRSAAAELRQRYRALRRPVSRGEIAVALLTPVLPAPETDSFSSSSPTDPATLSLDTIAFWKKNKDKTPAELAALYIATGSGPQQTQAASFLASSQDPAAHATFEKTVLESPEPVALIAQVDQYLAARKTAAKPFCAAYIELLTENPPTEEQLQRSPASYQIREAGGLANYLKKLSLSVGDVSLKKMIAEALEAETPEESSATNQYGRPQTPVTALAPAIQSIPLAECLVALGESEPNASPAQWMEIHQLLLGRIQYEYRNTPRDEPEAPQETPEQQRDTDPSPATLPPRVLEIWKPLLASSTPLPPEGSFSEYASTFGSKTTGDASTLLIELANSPQQVYGLQQFAQIEGSATAVIDFVRTRVNAWSRGKNPSTLAGRGKRPRKQNPGNLRQNRHPPRTGNHPLRQIPLPRRAPRPHAKPLQLRRFQPRPGRPPRIARDHRQPQANLRQTARPRSRRETRPRPR